MADRRTQMSAQAAIIAQKKAEIEAKKLSSAQPLTSSSTTSSSSSEDNKKPSSQKFVLTNRFGLKGKPKSSESNPPTSPSTISSSPVSIDARSSLLNSFNNDGSFLEQFKRLEQKKTVKVETVVKQEIPSGIFQPPPPAVEKPPEADDWYKEALERARKAAQSVKQAVHSKPDVKPEPIPIVDTSEYGPSLSQPSTSKSGVKPEFETSQMTPILNCQDLEPLPIVVQELASMVALSGDQLEDIARARNVAEEQLAFLQDTSCEMYRRYRMSVDSMRKGMTAERDRNKEDNIQEKKRKSRWGEEKQENVIIPQVVIPQTNLPPGVNPQLVQYAMRVFGSTDLTDDQWRQCEDQQKMSVVYNEMLKKKSQLEMLEQQGKRKYEYDSDEDTEGGTWEHKARRLEMEKTLNDASKLNEAGVGKHHIGDFLPPEELTKFMAKFQALQRGEDFDESDYQDNKLTQDNLGFKMLQRMGWSEGSGLGTEAQGITAPIGKGSANSDKKGLGTTVPHDLGKEDNEYDAYRKRMMLAYRFRPNPLVMEPGQKDEKQYAQFAPEIVTHLAESVGIGSLTPLAARELAEDGSYRIRMLVSVALKFSRHSRRDGLSVQDLERAMEVCNVEPVYGHGSGGLNEQGYTKVFDTTQTGIVRSPGVFFVPDEHLIDLREAALAPPTNVSSKNQHLRGSWLALEGVKVPDNQGKNSVLFPPRDKFECQVAPFVETILQGLLGEDEEVIKAVLSNVRTNTKISLFLPGLVSFCRNVVINHPKNPTIRLRVLSLLHAIVSNINVNLSPKPYLNSILRTLIHFVVQDRSHQGPLNRRFYEFSDTDFHMISIIFRDIILLWGSFFSELKVDCFRFLVGILESRNNYSVSAASAVVYILNYLGPQAVEENLLPSLTDILSRIEIERENLLAPGGADSVSKCWRESCLNYFEKVTTQALRTWINHVNKENQAHKHENTLWYNCISEQFGDSLNICHLPMYQDQKYKFKVDWIKGQKEKLPNSKTPSGKSSSEGSVNMFQTNDDFDFFSLGDLAPDVLGPGRTTSTSNKVIFAGKEPTFVSESLIPVFQLKELRIIKRDPIIVMNISHNSTRFTALPLEKLKRRKSSMAGSPSFTRNFQYGSRILIKRNAFALKRRDQAPTFGYNVGNIL